MEDNKGIAYFFLGLGVGVAVGMIFAPQAGTETRSLIRNRAGEGGDYLRRRGEKVKSGAEELVDRGKHLVNKQRDRLSASLEAGRQAYRESVTEPAAPGSDVAAPGEGI